MAVKERTQAAPIDGIEGDAEEQEVTIRVALVQFLEIRQLGQARGAPGGPEVEQDDATFELVAGPLAAFEINPGDIIPD